MVIPHSSPKGLPPAYAESTVTARPPPLFGLMGARGSARLSRFGVQHGGVPLGNADAQELSQQGLAPGRSERAAGFPGFFSAARAAPWMLLRGQMTNSSPPMRHTMSLLRTALRRRWPGGAAVRRHLAWPGTGRLPGLKWSASSSSGTSACRRAWPTARCSAATAKRRLGRPGEVVLAGASAAAGWRIQGRPYAAPLLRRSWI